MKKPPGAKRRHPRNTVKTNAKSTFSKNTQSKESTNIWQKTHEKPLQKQHKNSPKIDGKTIPLWESIEVKKDQTLAKLKIIYDDEEIGEYELLAFNDVKKVNIFSRLMKSLNYLIWGDV